MNEYHRPSYRSACKLPRTYCFIFNVYQHTNASTHQQRQRAGAKCEGQARPHGHATHASAGGKKARNFGAAITATTKAKNLQKKKTLGFPQVSFYLGATLEIFNAEEWMRGRTNVCGTSNSSSSTPGTWYSPWHLSSTVVKIM